MASQITHVVLADKLYKIYFTHLSYDEFIAGNAFPDIRKLAQFDRHLTHQPVQSIGQVQDTANAFLAGMWLHSYLDVVCEQYMEQHDVYELFKISSDRATVIKLYTDELLYPKISDWTSIIKILNTTYDSELAYPASAAQVELWNKALQVYFARPMDPSVLQQYVESTGKDQSWLRDYEIAHQALVEQPEAAKIIENLYDDLETLVA